MRTTRSRWGRICGRAGKSGFGPAGVGCPTGRAGGGGSTWWWLLCAAALANVATADPAPTEAPQEAPTDAPQEAYAPCGPAPAGMVCIPGGTATVGDEAGGRYTRPARKVEISTFYMDTHEVTIADYQACVQAKACQPLQNQHQNIMKPFVSGRRPAVPVDWYRAHEYCIFAGKRLPTEWEWEKVARGPEGTVYPWGDEAPTCDKAQFRECAPAGCQPYPGKRHAWDCVEHATRDVGSFPAGHYGVFDMAGNGYEWTASWAADLKSCGAACRGKDPQGPCGGMYPCRKHPKKVLRGGSWYWPKEQLKGFHRRPETPKSGGHRLSFRCATSEPWLTRFPPRVLTESRPVPPPLSPPTAEQQKIAAAVREDAVEKKNPCEKAGRAFTDCRDPNHYVKTNEPRQALYAPYIKNLGGGYVGVGIDQNYSLMALARSEWAWLFDYDPTITRLHHVLRAMILRSENIDAFVLRFSPQEKERSLKLLAAEYADSKEKRAYREVFRVYRGALFKHYQRTRGARAYPGEYGWLRFEEQYAYIRSMYQQGRIILRKGDMLARHCMQDIGAAARALGVPIRIYYPSNAPELWPFSPQYKQNVRNLPFDAQTLVLQTTSGMRRRFGQKGYWHYNIQAGLDQQAWMARKETRSLRQILYEHLPADVSDLSLIGLRSD